MQPPGKFEDIVRLLLRFRYFSKEFLALGSRSMKLHLKLPLCRRKVLTVMHEAERLNAVKHDMCSERKHSSRTSQKETCSSVERCRLLRCSRCKGKRQRSLRPFHTRNVTRQCEYVCECMSVCPFPSWVLSPIKTPTGKTKITECDKGFSWLSCGSLDDLGGQS